MEGRARKRGIDVRYNPSERVGAQPTTRGNRRVRRRCVTGGAALDGSSRAPRQLPFLPRSLSLKRNHCRSLTPLGDANSLVN